MVGRGELEEDIYQTHFQFTHFTLLLRNDFHQHLAIPKTFSDDPKNKLPGNVSLKGPSGAIWNIGLTTNDDTLYFTQGWKQFVKDHSLKENDFLVFKYDGDSLFEVIIFVQASGHANVKPHDNVQQHDKKRGTDSSDDDVKPSDAGVTVARFEQFADDEATSKRTRRPTNKQRGSVTDSSGSSDPSPISDPVGTRAGLKVRLNRNSKPSKH